MGKRSVKGYSHILLMIMVFIVITTVSAISPVEITVNPASQIVEKGRELIINISIDPVNKPITAAQFDLLVNSSLIEVKNITEGNLFRQNGANAMFNSGIINNTGGTLIHVWGLIITPGANVTSKGNLATITMYAKDTGISRINLTDVIVSDPDSQAVQINIMNGSINISAYDTVPPASIINLHNTSYAQNYIKWIWTDPVDPDFSKVMIYLDGEFKTNVSNGIKYYNATGLIASTSYTIATRTVDTNGNINRTWVNHTARTAPDAIPPRSITNITNISYAQSYIKWVWTDPTDSDFSKVMIYLDGKFRTNVSKGIKYYNATGLIANIIYTVATRTVDTSGNINRTWVNHTARTAPDSIPPASVTNLTNISYAKSYIKWTWTDPTDLDFSKVMIYLDGKFKTNISKGIKYYNTTGLIANTSHTIATRTVDTSGNINRTWVNRTARTAPR